MSSAPKHASTIVPAPEARTMKPPSPPIRFLRPPHLESRAIVVLDATQPPREISRPCSSLTSSEKTSPSRCVAQSTQPPSGGAV